MFAFNMEKYIRRTLTDCTDKTLFLFALNRLFWRKCGRRQSWGLSPAEGQEIQKYANTKCGRRQSMDKKFELELHKIRIKSIDKYIKQRLAICKKSHDGLCDISSINIKKNIHLGSMQIAQRGLSCFMIWTQIEITFDSHRCIKYRKEDEAFEISNMNITALKYI